MLTPFWILVSALTLSCMIYDASACMCIRSHPQEHYCSADFVAVVRVKSRGKGDGGTTAYHIKVKKEFKMTEKARHALSQGLIWTSSQDATCGVTLHPRRYLIAGLIRGEKPWVSLCHFVQEWPKLSKKQKKGFRKLYQQGCRCRVRDSKYMRWYGHQQQRERYCSWDTVHSEHQDCQALYTICVPSVNNQDQCSWSTNSQYKRCMKELKLARERQRELEP